ncbi:MAG: hypothetical protein IKL72_06400 [Firmicutes bacterium]|nr:hypothetical protein [Bacillota bacterium]
MSDIFDRYEYLKKLWLDFYGLLKMDEESEKMASALENQLDKKTRWELIQLIDQMNLECERVSLKSFISGFRVAMGIAKEISYEAKFLEKD